MDTGPMGPRRGEPARTVVTGPLAPYAEGLARGSLSRPSANAQVKTASLGRLTAARLRAGLPTLRLDRDFQSSDSLEVDPDLRIIVDGLGEHVVAVRAAEHDAGASVDVNGPDRPGCTAAAAGPDRGCHLDGEHLLEETCDRVPVQHQLAHVTVRWVRSVRS